MPTRVLRTYDGKEVYENIEEPKFASANGGANPPSNSNLVREKAQRYHYNEDVPIPDAFVIFTKHEKRDNPYSSSVKVEDVEVVPLCFVDDMKRNSLLVYDMRTEKCVLELSNPEEISQLTTICDTELNKCGEYAQQFIKATSYLYEKQQAEKDDDYIVSLDYIDSASSDFFSDVKDHIGSVESTRDKIPQVEYEAALEYLDWKYSFFSSDVDSEHISKKALHIFCRGLEERSVHFFSSNYLPDVREERKQQEKTQKQDNVRVM